MKLDPGMHIGMHLVFFGKSGVTISDSGTYGPAAFDANDLTGDVGCRRHAEE
jgi:hypothetical protein